MKKKPLQLLIMLSKNLLWGMIFQTFCFSIILAAPGNAQKIQSVREVEINLDESDLSITALLKRIEIQTEFKFFYDKRFINKDLTFSFQNRRLKVADVLMEISRRANLKFKQVNNTINISVNKRRYSPNDAMEVIIQEKKITGKITSSEENEPLPGVNVVEKGTTNGTVTDLDGEYTLTVNSGATLVFSSVGYTSEEVLVGNRSVIDLVMSEDVQQLQELVVVGYGTVKKSDLTSAISRVESKDIAQRVTPRLDEALQGQLSGVSVQQTSGVPGSAPLIKIRGVGSISSGNAPLFVIDGFPVEDNSIIGSLNMNDVESIEVLKDAASAAIYGSRGSNGVVLITTKKGKPGKPTISFRTYAGVQQPEKLIEFMDGNELGQMITEIRNHYWVEAGGNANDPNDVRPGNRRIDPQWTSGNQPTYDPQDYAFQTAPMQNHSLSVSGGTENTNYFVSLDYLNQEGIAKGTSFDRYSVRANLESDISDRIKIGLNISPSYSVQVDRDTEGKDNTLNRIMMHPSIIPFDFYWDPSRGIIANDYAEQYSGLNRGRWFFEFERVPDNRKRAQILTNAFADFEIIEGLNFRSSVGLIYNGFDRERFYDLEAGQGTIQSDRWSSNSTNWLWENTLNYSKTIGRHSFTALAGYTSQKDQVQSTFMRGRGHANDLSETINNATQITDWDESVNEWALISILGRITYNFDSRYLFTASIRRDGSSRFGDNNLWGVFPSVSGAWRVSEEAFMQNVDFISNLKLRASWGQTGNNRIGNYSSIAGLRSANALLGENENPQAGLLPAGLGNPDLGWERTSATNIGFDLGILGDRINLTAEFYNNITNDLLLNVPIPLVTGFENQLRNIGEVSNKGFEFDIYSRNVVGDFQWNTRLNFSNNKNEVLKMGPNDAPIISGEWYATVSYTGVGKPIGSYYMHVQDGIFQNQAEVDAGPLWSNEGIGDVKLKDVDGDGDLDNDDRDFVGQPYPIWTAGLTNEFRYKNFDLSVFINGAGGHKSFFITGRYYDRSNINNIKSYTANWVNRWKSESEPGDGRTPTVLSTATTNGGIPTTRWLYDSDWWRVKNITLGYTFPSSLTERIGIQNLRLYATGDNLFLGTKYPGYNPEGVTLHGENVSRSAGYEYGVYPLSRRYVFGLNLSF